MTVDAVYILGISHRLTALCLSSRLPGFDDTHLLLFHACDTLVMRPC